MFFYLFWPTLFTSIILWVEYPCFIEEWKHMLHKLSSSVYILFQNCHWDGFTLHPEVHIPGPLSPRWGNIAVVTQVAHAESALKSYTSLWHLNQQSPYVFVTTSFVFSVVLLPHKSETMQLGRETYMACIAFGTKFWVISQWMLS